LSYVFIDNGRSTIKKEVLVGQSNENEIIVRKGLSEGMEVYLNIPDNPDDLSIEKLED
jgi:hypothetical protein